MVRGRGLGQSPRTKRFGLSEQEVGKIEMGEEREEHGRGWAHTNMIKTQFNLMGWPPRSSFTRKMICGQRPKGNRALLVARSCVGSRALLVLDCSTQGP